MNKITEPKSYSQSGFTLIELLVGVALSLFIIAISITYLVSSSRSYSAQTNDDIIQENARFTLEILTQHLRLAGLNPGAELDDELDVILTSRFCATDDQGVAEGSISESSSADASCTKDSNASTAFSSDRFGFDYKVESPTATCSGARVTEAMIDNSGGTLTLASVFWVQDNTDRAGVRSLYCQTFDKENNQTIGPALPLIDGIDAMQVQYGRDTNGDSVVDSYVNFTDLVNGVASPTDATRNVELVRIAMLISSGLDSGSSTAVSASAEVAEDIEYSLLDADSFTVSADDVLRQVFSTTILIPNSLGE